MSQQQILKAIQELGEASKSNSRTVENLLKLIIGLEKRIKALEYKAK